MAYADYLDDPSVRNRYLVYIIPKRLCEGFTVVSGNVYSIPFDYGKVVDTTQWSLTTLQESNQLEASDETLSDGGWFHDGSTLFMKFTGGADIPSNYVVTAYYALNFSTSELYYFRDPEDNTTEETYYIPALKEPSSVSVDLSESTTGFIQIANNTLRLINTDFFLNRHVYDSSFNNAVVKVVHLVGDEILEENTSIIYRGFCSDVSWDQNEVTINTFNDFELLKKERRNSQYRPFFTSSDFPNIDPYSMGKPIPFVYGMVNGHVATNIDYNDSNPTTSNNRKWATTIDGNGVVDDFHTVVSATVSSITLDSVVGITPGDTIWVDKAVDEFIEVTGVGYAPSNTITFSTNLSVAPIAGDKVRIAGVPRVEIIMDGATYLAYYKRDYEMFAPASIGGPFTKVNGFTFNSTLEVNVGLPRTLRPTDSVICKVYGMNVVPTLSGNDIGELDSETGTIMNPVSIVVDVMKNAGIEDSAFDFNSFNDHANNSDIRLAFSIPKTSVDGYSQIVTILADIFKSTLLKVYLDNDLKWKISRVDTLSFNSNTDKEATDSEDIKSTRYFFSYKDLCSEVMVVYGFGEVAARDARRGPVEIFYTTTSYFAQQVHGIRKTKRFDTLVYDEISAVNLGDRLLAIFSDRRGVLELEVGERFLDSLISDTIRVTREKLPGFEYEAGTLRSTDFTVTAFSKKGSQVSLTLDDQKGVADNSGDF